MKLIILGIVLSSIVSIPGRTIKYVLEPEYELIQAEVSAYTSSPEETDDTPHITASGSQTKHGIVACPSRFEFGTKVEIAGRQYVCEDRMSDRYSNKDVFDIWMNDKQLAIEWGRKYLEVKIY